MQLDESYRIYIPCFNEELNLELVIQDLEKYFDKPKLIVVNDGSTDGSLDLLRKLNVNVINHDINRGVGAVLRTAAQSAINENLRYFAVFDGDGQHIAKELNKLLEYCQIQNADVVIGNRFQGTNSINRYRMSYFRRYAIKFISLILYFKRKVRLIDVTSGMRVYGRDTFDFIANMRSDFYLADTVITIDLLLKNKFKILELPIAMQNRQQGKSSANIYSAFLNYFRALLMILRS